MFVAILLSLNSMIVHNVHVCDSYHHVYTLPQLPVLSNVVARKESFLNLYKWIISK